MSHAQSLTIPSWTDITRVPRGKTPTGNPHGFKAGLSENATRSITCSGKFRLFYATASLLGIITPSGVHYERHHSGWPDIDPREHRLLISGADQSFVSKPKVFTVEDLQRLPSVSRIHFIECSGNTGTERLRATAPTVQYTHVYCHARIHRCSPSTATRKLWYRPKSSEIRARRGRGCGLLTRTIPMDLVLNDEVLVAYGQNGEYLRPENGFPLRLIVPGVQASLGSSG